MLLLYIVFVAVECSATYFCPLSFKQHRKLMILYMSAMSWHSRAACLSGVRQYDVQMSPLSTARLLFSREPVIRSRAALHDLGMLFVSI